MNTPYPDAPDYDRAECERVSGNDLPSSHHERENLKDDEDRKPVVLSLSSVYLIRKSMGLIK